MVPAGTLSFVFTFPVTGMFTNVSLKSGFNTEGAIIGSTNICKVAVAHTPALVQAVYVISTGPLKPGAAVNT